LTLAKLAQRTPLADIDVEWHFIFRFDRNNGIVSRS